MEEEPVRSAEIVRAFGELIIVRHDPDRMVVLPRYADRNDTSAEDD